MPDTQLKVVGAQVNAARRHDIAGEVRPWLNVVIEVENQTTAPLHVWASQRGYDYDAAAKVLTMHLSEQPLVLPPHVIMISDHPRAPAQVEVAARSRATVSVRIPAIVRRAAGRDAGGGWIEDPIGEVRRVDVDVQYAPEPVEKPRQHETSAQFRSRLMGQGGVVHASVTLSSGSEQSSPKEK